MKLNKLLLLMMLISSPAAPFEQDKGQMPDRNIHLLCNAHIDPVWLWEWEEGAASAISTFRTAADLCEQFDDFIFNHNEVILYEWVETYEPELFTRIKDLVRKGKWHIMGGWYLQPDCNMPSGESFVRQILLGRQYFQEKFGVRPTTAINLDPFGHTRGLVQIMSKSGFDSYLFCRPTDYPVPATLFRWQGFDGSEIVCHKTLDWYNSPLGKARDKVERSIEEHEKESPLLVLWGVGNHGGGPSHLDVAAITDLIRNREDVNILHSTPEIFFSEAVARKESLPRHTEDINPTFPGCYTSQILIKQGHRRMENALYLTEKMATAAWGQRLMDYPASSLQEAMRDLAYSEFHDILPGSSIQPVEATSLRLLDHGLEILSRIRAKAFYALAQGQARAKDGEIPILVYNPHPFPVEKTITCELGIHDFNREGSFTSVRVFQNDAELPAQVEEELSNLWVDWRKRVVFHATLAPSQMNQFACRLEVIPEKPAPLLSAVNDQIHFKSDELEVVINTNTGLMDRYCVQGVDYLKGNAFAPIVIAHNEDPWGMDYRQYRDVAGKFALLTPEKSAEVSGVRVKSLAPVRVIEEGAARTVVESILGFNDSFMVLRYHLPGKGTEVEVEARVHWNEKDRMLKLSLPVNFEPSTFCGQTAYGVQELPDNGDECVAHKWVAVQSGDHAVTVCNNGTYGSDFKDNELRLSLLRSPAYSAMPLEDEPVMPQDRYSPRIDQGERLFHFWMNAGSKMDRMALIDREALVHNEAPVELSFFPSGNEVETKPFVLLDDKSVQISALKKAEKSDDIVVRLFEPTGNRREVEVKLPVYGMKRKVELEPFEIRTFLVNHNTKRWIESDLMEVPLKSGLQSSIP